MRVRSGLLIGLVVAVPLVTGATLEQWRKREPRWQASSTRSLEDLKGCLGSRWAGTLSARVVAIPIEHGMSYVNDGANRDILVDLTDDGDHRTIRLWLRTYMGITAGAKEQIEKLTGCVNG